MNRRFKRVIVLLGLLFLVAGWPAYQFYGELTKFGSEDPLVWERDIRELEARSAQAEQGRVVFVGSSSIRLWPNHEGYRVWTAVIKPVLQRVLGGA